MRHTVTLSPAAVLAAFALLCAPAGAQTLSPLPASDYSVRSVCGEPARGQAACLAMELVPETAAARAHSHPLGMTIKAGAEQATKPCETPTAAKGCFGLRPEDLHEAYALPDAPTGTQTIALVDAYNDPTAQADLKAYDEEFGLEECTTANRCFAQVNQSGRESDLPFPKSTVELEEHASGTRSERAEAEAAEGWTVEISLDIETAHAVCESCKIVLVEATNPTLSNLETAEDTAVSLGANEVSNSWGSPECVEEKDLVECIPRSSAFDHPGTVITVAAGDTGYENWDGAEKGFADYPASLPDVVAVGGTRLKLSEAGTWEDETVWNDGGKEGTSYDGDGAAGGGCSKQFDAELWQTEVSDWSSVGCGKHRAVADVSADADPYTGIAVYDSSSTKCEDEEGAHWCTIGGTSLASPLIASVFALAGGSGGVNFPSHTLYRNETLQPSSLHDVTEGSNGECDKPFEEPIGELGTSGCDSSEEGAASCSSHLSCLAGPGYDGPSGVGTPDGLEAFVPPAGGDGTEPTGAEEEAGSAKNKESESASRSSASPPPPPSSSTPPAPVVTTPGPTIAPQSPEKLSNLELTLKAIAALNTDHPRLKQLAFSFTSSQQTIVRAALQRLVTKHRHRRWQGVGGLELAATYGRNTQSFGGHALLGRGTYRLTVKPANGAARSLVFRIG